jgi:hypothetical protein
MKSPRDEIPTRKLRSLKAAWINPIDLIALTYAATFDCSSASLFGDVGFTSISNGVLGGIVISRSIKDMSTFGGNVDGMRGSKHKTTF